MNEPIRSVLILGLGKVGYLVALLLRETGFKVTGADLSTAEIAAPFALQNLDVTNETELTRAMQRHDAGSSTVQHPLF
jgi:prephenate dehydrogenase